MLVRLFLFYPHHQSYHCDNENTNNLFYFFLFSIYYLDAALLVFSLNSLESFHFISQHLLEILSLAENAKIFLVGNKSDKSLHEVSDSDIEMFMEQFPKFEGLYKVSCKNNTGVKEMFNEIAEKLANTSYKSNLDALKLHNQESSYVNESSSSNISDFCCAK